MRVLDRTREGRKNVVIRAVIQLHQKPLKSKSVEMFYRGCLWPVRKEIVVWTYLFNIDCLGKENSASTGDPFLTAGVQ